MQCLLLYLDHKISPLGSIVHFCWVHNWDLPSHDKELLCMVKTEKDKGFLWYFSLVVKQLASVLYVLGWLVYIKIRNVSPCLHHISLGNHLVPHEWVQGLRNVFFAHPHIHYSPIQGADYI